MGNRGAGWGVRSWVPALPCAPQMAFRYLSWILFPLLGCYAVYSLLYLEHKGWYSWVLSMLYGFLLTFGEQACVALSSPVRKHAQPTFLQLTLGRAVNLVIKPAQPSSPSAHSPVWKTGSSPDRDSSGWAGVAQGESQRDAGLQIREGFWEAMNGAFQSLSTGEPRENKQVNKKQLTACDRCCEGIEVRCAH